MLSLINLYSWITSDCWMWNSHYLRSGFFFREEIDLLVFHSAFLDSVKIFWTQLDIGEVLVSSAGHFTRSTVKTMFTNLYTVIILVCHLFGSAHLVCFKSPVLLPTRNVTATKVLSFQPLHEVTANQIFKTAMRILAAPVLFYEPKALMCAKHHYFAPPTLAI